jgi:hypothetical protein
MRDDTIYGLFEQRKVVTERYDARYHQLFDKVSYAGVWSTDCTEKRREAIYSANNNFVVEQL